MTEEELQFRLQALLEDLGAGLLIVVPCDIIAAREDGSPIYITPRSLNVAHAANVEPSRAGVAGLLEAARIIIMTSTDVRNVPAPSPTKH